MDNCRWDIKSYVERHGHQDEEVVKLANEYHLDARGNEMLAYQLDWFDKYPRSIILDCDERFW